ncbi:uncharacterized protein LOC119309067 [Triticum dicoccoides]|uniref:uncharacterized protein LOC119309067 n=1 Tax=Triticum dicoccoides TaxID=85692 RepID=UPI000E791EAE|nr:uncharacterized protein LOC119309067 [Triticum dicoccoides]XP_037441058.1 uncharacterized protein LOC119309067 [Triticum dicoccoides]XP_037441059.1 uncharacterized protein LOC119309067 [Triticum dicoccoides]XP_037441060.1 uncharacterized protein LOC119309067 [Triticum dicoccoides]
MAAAEARAAWQRAANRCLFQEDAKRAPKLACCPPTMQQHEANSGNPTSPRDCHIPNFMHLNWNPMNSNQPIDAWFLQLQPNFGCHKVLSGDHLNYMGGEATAKKVDSFSPISTLDDINTKKSECPSELPWMVSTAFMKQTSEAPCEGCPQTSLKCRGNPNDFLHEDKEVMDFKTFDPLFPKKPKKACYEMDPPWEQERKCQPWWQVADEEGLASLVAERAMQHIENNDLPKPTQIVRIHGAKLNGHENKDGCGNSLSSSGKESRPQPHDTMMCSYSLSSTNETNSSDGGGWQQSHKNDAHGGTQDSYSSGDHTPGSKPTYQNQKDAERAQLLDALRHSQTRAREAEVAAKNAHDEKDHVVKLLFRQASHLFACKQWLKMLQLENICLQLRLKEHQIAAMFPELPWTVMKEEKAEPEEGRKGRAKKKGRRQSKEGGFCKAIMFAVGVGIVGAGLLLGWTFGWLLPRL